MVLLTALFGRKKRRNFKVRVEKRFLREGQIFFILLSVLVQGTFIASDGDLNSKHSRQKGEIYYIIFRKLRVREGNWLLDD